MKPVRFETNLCYPSLHDMGATQYLATQVTLKLKVTHVPWVKGLQSTGGKLVTFHLKMGRALLTGNKTGIFVFGPVKKWTDDLW